MLVASPKIFVVDFIALGLGLLAALVAVANMGLWIAILRGQRTSRVPPIDVVFALAAAWTWRRVHPDARWSLWAAMVVVLFELPLLAGLIWATCSHLAFLWRMPPVFRRHKPEVSRLGDSNVPMSGKILAVEGNEFVLATGTEEHRFPIAGPRDCYVIGRAVYARFTSNRDEPARRTLTEVRIARR